MRIDDVRVCEMQTAQETTSGHQVHGHEQEPEKLKPNRRGACYGERHPFPASTGSEAEETGTQSRDDCRIVRKRLTTVSPSG